MSGNPFQKINADRKIDIKPFKSEGVVSFRYDNRSGEEVACGVSLSTLATLRGIDFSSYNIIVFDEAVPMVGEKPIKNEFDSFLNFVETVSRNREIVGE